MTNQRKIVLYIAASLDGYIATNDESLDWLFKVEGEGDNGISEFYETVDTILMGKRTYDWVIKNMSEDFPYKDKECYVFSRSTNDTNGNNNDVKFFNGDLVNFANELKSKVGKSIWLVGGGELLLSFIKEKLVDEIIVTIAPTLIGKGIPLFKEDDYQFELTLKGVRRFNQFVELSYEVRR